MSAETGCFYVPLGEERFRATELTATPWGSGSQHGGPPAALLGRALEYDAGGEGGIFARLAFEILGPIPVGELSIEVKTVRPGRRISLHEATLSDGARRPVMLCRAWRISATMASLPDDHETERRTLPGPERGEEKPFFEMAPEVGYHQGIEARFVEGSWRELGVAAAWLRMRVPLLPGEEPSPPRIPATAWGLRWTPPRGRSSTWRPQFICTPTRAASGSAWSHRPPSSPAASASRAPPSTILSWDPSAQPHSPCWSQSAEPGDSVCPCFCLRLL